MAPLPSPARRPGAGPGGWPPRGLAAIVLLMALAVLMAGCQRERERVKTVTPDIALEDLSGARVPLSSYRGKVILLEFWATWCPPCRDAVPELNEVHRRFRDGDFVLIGASIGEDPETLKEFIAEYGVEYTVMIDADKVHERFGVLQVPVSFIIDKEGNVVAKHPGSQPGLTGLWIKEIEELL